MNAQIAQIKETPVRATNDGRIHDLEISMRRSSAHRDALERERVSLYEERNELVRVSQHLGLVVGDAHDGKAAADASRQTLAQDLLRYYLFFFNFRCERLIQEKEAEITASSFDQRMAEERKLKQQYFSLKTLESTL